MTGSGADSFFDVASALTHVALPAMRPVAWDSKHPLNIPGPIYVGDDCYFLETGRAPPAGAKLPDL